MKPYHDHSDTELMNALLNGDQKAFEAIYMRYSKDLYRYARKSIPVKEDCQEIVQEVFESLWSRHENLFHVNEFLAGYLFRMVKNKIANYFKHLKVKNKYQEHYMIFEAVYAQGIPDNDYSTFHEMIDKSLADLPERCQMAVKLRLTENLSNAEIAKRMDIKKMTVKNYIVTALSHLRENFPRTYKSA